MFLVGIFIELGNEIVVECDGANGYHVLLISLGKIGRLGVGWDFGKFG